MKLDNILGKILALTKQIHFTEPPDGTGFVTKFFAGKTKPFPPIGSIGLEWWSSKSGFNLREDIANMAILFDPQLQGGDTASFCQQIDDILKENVVNREIFDIDKILLMRVNTLFDGRSIRDERDFALKLWNIIHNAFEESMINWIILYPLNRVKAKSTLFDFDGLSLLASNDLDAWEEICKKLGTHLLEGGGMAKMTMSLINPPPLGLHVR
jgi:hypothetical protein